MNLPASLHGSLLADQLRAYEQSCFFVGEDRGKDGEKTTVISHREGPALVIDKIIHHSPAEIPAPPTPTLRGQVQS